VVVETLPVSLRAILVLLALLVGALALLFWLDGRGPGPEGTRPGRSLVEYAPDRYRAIEIANREGEARLERADDGAWWLTRPLNWRANPETVDRLFLALSQISVVRTVTDEPGGDLDGFGLSSPETSLYLFPQGGATARRILVGAESPSGGERYVLDETGAVVLVEPTIHPILVLWPLSFMERRFAPVEPGDVTGITVRGPSAGLRLRLREGRWWLTEPVEDLADNGTVTDMIWTLAGLGANKLLDVEEIDLARGAFDDSVTVTVEPGTGEGPTGIEIGTPAGPDQWFARRPGDDRFWGIVGETLLTLLVREVEDLRERRLALFSRPDVREIRVESAEGALRLVRVDPRTWEADEPGGAAATVPAEAVEAFLDRLRWLRARGFGDGGGEPGARILEIALSDADAELGRLTLQRLDGARDAEGNDLIRARSSWRPGFSFTVGAELLDAVPRSVDDLRDLPEASSPGDETE
jgi:hypothetical protein